eukprot:6206944-Pleurochrysis_carterae.AAC.1
MVRVPNLCRFVPFESLCLCAFQSLKNRRVCRNNMPSCTPVQNPGLAYACKKLILVGSQQVALPPWPRPLIHFGHLRFACPRTTKHTAPARRAMCLT